MGLFSAFAFNSKRGTTPRTAPERFDDFLHVRDFGAKGNGTTDDYPAFQAAFDAAVDGDMVFFNRGSYVLSDTPTTTKNITVRGSGCVALRPSWNDSTAWSSPSVGSILAGAILVPSTAGKDALCFPGSAQNVHLFDFGIHFKNGLASTGHGINATPSTVVGTQLDHGVFESRWSNIMVYGHDGNHYGFNVVNPCYNTFDHLRSFGGGLLNLETRSDIGNYGNTKVINLSGAIIRSGTAHGIQAKAGQIGPGLGQILNLMTFDQPQIIVTSGANIAVQHAFKAIHADLYRIILPGFEPSSALVDYGDGRYEIDGMGIHGALGGTKFVLESANRGALKRYSDLTTS